MNELFNDNGGLIDRLAWKNIDNHKKYLRCWVKD